MPMHGFMVELAMGYYHEHSTTAGNRSVKVNFQIADPNTAQWCHDCIAGLAIYPLLHSAIMCLQGVRSHQGCSVLEHLTLY